MPSSEQFKRGCRHEVLVHYWMPHPKYGEDVPYAMSRLVEIPCDKSCGQRD